MALTRIQKIGIAGGCLFVFSILFKTAIFPAVLKTMVKKKIALKQGWIMRDIWTKFPFSFEFQFYMFNITNPEEIAKGEKPRVQEVGPYIYEEWQEKTNQMDHEEDDTVSSTLRNTYIFNAEKSKSLTGDEELTIPNYFALGTINTVLKEKPSAIPIVGKAIDSIMKKPSSLFMKAKVKDILFDGLPIDCNVNDFAGSAVCGEIANNYEKLRLKKAGENVFLMSLWGSFNATDSPKRTRVYRGIKNLMDVGKVVEYDNKKNISVWDDDYCDAFNGSDGTVFHPFYDKKGKDDVISFNAGLCRSFSCHYIEKAKFKGLKLLRYTADLGTDPDNNPLHKCYCEKPGECLKKGVYDVTKCVDAPLIMSNPHFYLADEYYLGMVDGLSPDKDKHMLFVDIDPFTGSPVHAHARAQFNMFITKVEKFKLMKNFPEALLPLMWIDEILVIPDFLVKEIKMGYTQLAIASVFEYLMIFGSLGMCGYAGFFHYKQMQAEKQPPKKPVSKPTSAEKKMTISTVQAPVPPNVE